jgi:hypothetical protein
VPAREILLNFLNFLNFLNSLNFLFYLFVDSGRHSGEKTGPSSTLRTVPGSLSTTRERWRALLSPDPLPRSAPTSGPELRATRAVLHNRQLSLLTWWHAENCRRSSISVVINPLFQMRKWRWRFWRGMRRILSARQSMIFTRFIGTTGKYSSGLNLRIPEFGNFNNN